MRTTSKQAARWLVAAAVALAAGGPAGLGLPAAMAAPSANVFVVNTTADTAGPGDNALSLREAVLVANGALTQTFGSGEQTQLAAGGCGFAAGVIVAGTCGAGRAEVIQLPAGTYSLTIAGSDDHALTGDLDIRDELTIEGAGLMTTTIVAVSAERVIDVVGPTTAVSVTLSHLALTRVGPSSTSGIGLYNWGGRTTLMGVYVHGLAGMSGAGIYNTGWLTLTQSAISDNAASVHGGGLYNQPEAVLVAQAPVVFANNTADSNLDFYGRGGGLYNAGRATLTGLAVTGAIGPESVLFLDNQAAEGGAIANVAGAITGTAVYLLQNTAATLGGGVYNAGDPEHFGLLRLEGSALAESQAAQGGGIYNGSRGEAWLAGALVYSNTAQFEGGGLLNAGGHITFEAASLIMNAALNGGGAAVAGPGLVSLTNATVARNQTRGDGGGLYANGGVMRLLSSTVVSNTADVDANGSGNGGGVAVAGATALPLANTIVGNNSDLTPAGSVHPDCSGALDSGGYNLVENTAGCTSVAATGDQTGVDPGLRPPVTAIGALPASGRPYPAAVFVPQWNSPALDAGNPGAPGIGPGLCPAVDLLGLARPVGPRCDIGAAEHPPVDLALAASAPDAVGPGGLLPYTVRVANHSALDVSASVSFALPAGTALSGFDVPPGWMCAHVVGLPESCGTSSLPPGATETLTFTLTAPLTRGPFSLSFALTGPIPDPAPENNLATVLSRVGAEVRLPVVSR